jgi:hypothetical protein
VRILLLRNPFLVEKTRAFKSCSRGFASGFVLTIATMANQIKYNPKSAKFWNLNRNATNFNLSTPKQPLTGDKVRRHAILQLVTQGMPRP